MFVISAKRNAKHAFSALTRIHLVSHPQSVYEENNKRELYDKAITGYSYRTTGIRCFNEGDFHEALEYHQLHLKIAEEIADRAGEGIAYASLGTSYLHLRESKKAIEYHQRHLSICKELGDRSEEGRAYSNLGSDYYSLQDFTKAVEYHHLHLSIAKQLDDKPGEQRAYANIGVAYFCLKDFTKAIEYHRMHLSIAKQLGDRPEEGTAYANLGTDYASLGNFKKAVQYYKLHLGVAQEIGDRFGEERAYTNLGVAYRHLEDFKTAIEYHQQQLSIAKDLADRKEECRAYASVGNCYRSLGDFQNAIKNYELNLSVARELGDREGEERAYASLSFTYCFLSDFKKAINCSQLGLSIAKEVGNRVGEGKYYGNLGDAYHSLGNFEKAIEYHQLALSISKEVRDKAQEGHAYQSLGRDHCALGDFEKGIEYHQLHLNVSKEVGDKAEEGIAYNHLGNTYNSLGDFFKAVDCYKLSVNLFSNLRNNTHANDGWNSSLCSYHRDTYTALWKLLLQQSKFNEALMTAEKGRRRALMDLTKSRYGLRSPKFGSSDEKEDTEALNDVLSYISSQTVVLAVGRHEINFWVLSKGKDPHFVQRQIDEHYLKEIVIASLVFLNEDVQSTVGFHESFKLENRSLDDFTDEELPIQKSDKKRSTPTDGPKDDPLRVLYDAVIGPIADSIHGNEITIVPDGPLLVAPFAAFRDKHFRYLSETRIVRLIPTLSSLKLLAEPSSQKCHKTIAALLVGDPWVESGCVEIKRQKKEKKKRKKKGQKKEENSFRLSQLPAAKKEVEIIGNILDIEPLTGKEATKQEVLKRLPSATLVHIAAHGKAETGEIALSPNPAQSTEIPKEEDYILTVKDVENGQMQAQLVVLSCYHSSGGEIRSEGVMGVARAFLGAGARSVLAPLWAISDDATQEFMRHFYNHLVDGLSASISLNQAVKMMQKSDRFSSVGHWAPFILIGDDVTLDFGSGR